MCSGKCPAHCLEAQHCPEVLTNGTSSSTMFPTGGFSAGGQLKGSDTTIGTLTPQVLAAMGRSVPLSNLQTGIACSR